MPPFSLSQFAAFSLHYWTSDPIRFVVAVVTAAVVLAIGSAKAAEWYARQRHAWLLAEIERETREQKEEWDRTIARAKEQQRQKDEEARKVHRLVSPHARSGGKDAA